MVQTFDSSSYETEFDVRKAVEGPMSALNEGTLVARVEMAFGNLITKYLTEVLPELKHSTQDTNRSVIGLHIKPQWEVYRIADIEAYDVDRWISSLAFGQASKVWARNPMKRLSALAMLWKCMPFGRNPMSIVKVKKGSKRLKKIVIITPEQFKAAVQALPAPYSLMVLVCGWVGLRVSETLALKWADITSTVVTK